MKSFSHVLMVALMCSPLTCFASGEARPTAQAIEAHTRFLAHDLLGGRDPGALGYDIAAEYVAAHFRSHGLQPAGDKGTYFQAVPLRRRELVGDGARFALHGSSGTVS